MLEQREEKPDDQEIIGKAHEMIHHLILNHPEISGELWFSALMATIVEESKKSGLRPDQYRDLMEDAIKHYLLVWDDI